ncbi:hypothetical protein MATL_G00252490 [Megalops atlanticus]|uniref:Uncharacterized protein n=1 Tax=Megalops atlanticus TaxID=7932 RepID=A0A9D3P9M2_MEGAT|nr:hypothetical protein MATL_G00252490 [Megalops atlanticus]
MEIFSELGPGSRSSTWRGGMSATLTPPQCLCQGQMNNSQSEKGADGHIEGASKMVAACSDTPPRHCSFLL